ncbi:hypothetical protein Moror_5306 [Moniliophthora roreri MCA 2997]|nr:hypothetical protein Moror_5306 [Moniliophthora roreri MCA 2997]KAI3595053.1 hypothetical protein WG66_001114 [Moniliophthora roreri]
MKRPGLTVTVSVQDTDHQNANHNVSNITPNTALPSSIPTISSLSSPEPATIGSQVLYKAQDNHPGRPNFEESKSKPLPSLEEISDRESTYSHDSACVILTPKPRVQRVATPQTALTFAAIWDPDHGFTTISGRQLLHKASQLSFSLNDDENLEYDAFGNGHPECEPHLPSRFSTTTTSTSNYINVDFSPEDAKHAFPFTTPEVPQDDDTQTSRLPQIFNVGQIRPRLNATLRSQSSRPVISEPFQLTSSLFYRKTTTSSRIISESRPSTADSSTVKSQSSLSRFPRRPDTPQVPKPETRSPSPDFPITPTSRRPRLPSVFGRLKRTNPQNEGWVFIDITPRMRLVYLDE